MAYNERKEAIMLIGNLVSFAVLIVMTVMAYKILNKIDD